jgi:hypothetical protein
VKISRIKLDHFPRRGNPPDNVKSAAGDMDTKAKSRLGLTGVGNDQMAFARNKLAPLLKAGMAVYAELKNSFFRK